VTNNNSGVALCHADGLEHSDARIGLRIRGDAVREDKRIDRHLV